MPKWHSGAASSKIGRTCANPVTASVPVAPALPLTGQRLRRPLVVG